MRTKQNPWFIEERAVAFVSLALTKGNDVVIRPHSGADQGIDFLVEVLKGGKSTLRFFGVQLVASLDLPGSQNAADPIQSHLPAGQTEATLPLCVFLIGVRKPEGVYRWLVEPVVEDGRALLHRPGEARWETLDEAGVARLIDQVNGWYDALNRGPTPKARGRH